MSFLGMFRSKEEKEMDKIQKKLFTQAFPGGRKQVNMEIDEISKLLDGRYSISQINKIYTHITFLFVIAQDKTKERIVMSTKIKLGDEIIEEDILKVYRYITNKFLKQHLKIEDQSFLDDISYGIFDGNGEGFDLDEIPGSYGDFGLSPTNPIPTNGIAGSDSYLKRLKSIDNEEIKWTRTGPCFSDNIENVIDKYELFNASERFLATIYVSPYHKRSSNKAPNGFKLLQSIDCIKMRLNKCQ